MGDPRVLAQDGKRVVIVVGVDGSATARRALRWATEEAARRGAALEVVHAEFARPELLDPYPDLVGSEQRVLADAVESVRAVAPEVPVTGVLAGPPAADALVEASDGATMLVVGTRAARGWRHLGLGSVSAECVRRARCPVVVVEPVGEAAQP